MRKLLLLIIFSHFGKCYLAAQQVDKGFELQELIKVAEAYRQAPNLSFDITYTYADSAKPATVLEQMQGSSKLKDGMYWSFLDSIEYVQGYQYSLAIYHQDSVIAISDKPEYGNLLQLPLMDSLFREANISSLSIETFQDSLKRLTILFNENSLYTKYRLFYEPNSGLIHHIEYYTKEVAQNDEGFSGKGIITIQFSNYLFDTLSDEQFREDRFIYKMNGEFNPKPAFANYQLLVNTAK